MDHKYNRMFSYFCSLLLVLHSGSGYDPCLKIQEVQDRVRCAEIIKEGKNKRASQPQQDVRDEQGRNLYEDMVVDAESLGALQH